MRRFRRLDPREVTAVLVHGHGPFCWGGTAAEAAHAAYVLEELAQMAWATTVLNPDVPALSAALHRRHYTRKHGPGAYYGQAVPRLGR